MYYFIITSLHLFINISKNVVEKERHNLSVFDARTKKKKTIITITYKRNFSHAPKYNY